jgi:hypothetical protein
MPFDTTRLGKRLQFAPIADERKLSLVFQLAPFHLIYDVQPIEFATNVIARTNTGGLNGLLC